MSMRFRECHEQKFLGPNTLIKQGAKLVATWRMFGRTCPPISRRPLRRRRMNPGSGERISIPGRRPSPHEKKILKLLKADESTQIDELVEALENEMSSSEIFAALFELELNGKIRQLPGKNFVKAF